MKNIINPYNNIDWNNIEHKLIATHKHMEEQEYVENYHSRGGDIFTGFDYNLNLYPLEESYPDLDQEIIDDFVEIPNAEHRIGWWTHYTCPGSLFTDGEEKTLWGDSRKKLFENMRDNPLYENLVTIIMAHHTRREEEDEPADLEKLIDYAETLYDVENVGRGIEIYNASSDSEDRQGEWSLEFWDNVLSQGMYFTGHTVPDHRAKYGSWEGHEFVLVENESPSQKEILENLKNGKLYCSFKNSDLKFTKIEENNKIINIELNDVADKIKFIADSETKKIVENDNNAEYKSINDVYVRVEVYKDDEIIFTQPIMFRTKKMIDFTKEKKKKLLLI